MKIALFGASGTIGKCIAKEALNRGHEVTAISRHPEKFQFTHLHLHSVACNSLDPESVAKVVAGHDVVVNAIGPASSDSSSILVAAAKSLIEGVSRAGVSRLIVSGGAGSLEVAPGVQLVDTPDFPVGWKDVSLAHREALEIYRASSLDWTYLSPAAIIEPGDRTGSYRTGTDQLLTDEKGNSHISLEDFAIAIVDEIESPRFIRRRFTAAY